MRRVLLAPMLLAACGGDDAAGVDAPVRQPTPDLTRDIVSTQLALDLTARSGTATIALAPSTGDGATLEVGDLDIRAVRAGGADLAFARDGAHLDLAVGPEATTVAIDYGWSLHDQSDGAATAGYTLTWPYYCGNLFPCHSLPADGSTFALAITGVPAGDTAVYPPTIPTDAAAYQLAWAVGPYVETTLGTTTAGTRVATWAYATEATAMATGTRHLVAGFDWMEQHVGPYAFGGTVGSVSAHWGGGAYGGMEHHPRWHIASDALGDQSVHLHEAAHGWFGDGVRLACWEDFALSEGAATYYEARLAEEVGDAGDGTAAWADLDRELTAMRNGGGAGVAWPQSCNAIDVLTIFSRVPYVKGALWLRAVERKITRPVFDQAMRAFYAAHGGKAASITDLVTAFRDASGYDATACAQSWLAQRPVPTDLTCP